MQRSAFAPVDGISALRPRRSGDPRRKRARQRSGLCYPLSAADLPVPPTPMRPSNQVSQQSPCVGIDDAWRTAAWDDPVLAPPRLCASPLHADWPCEPSRLWLHRAVPSNGSSEDPPPSARSPGHRLCASDRFVKPPPQPSDGRLKEPLAPTRVDTVGYSPSGKAFGDSLSCPRKHATGTRSRFSGST